MATRLCNNPTCTNQLDEQDAFCGVCGTPANQDLTLLATNKQATVCGNCGSPLRPGKNFCLRCGTGTTLVIPGNTATICMSCGHSRNQFQATCPVCNSQAPTMPAFGVPYVSIIPSQVVSPPLIIPNPTEQDIFRATTATDNPYIPHCNLKKLENFHSVDDIRTLPSQGFDYWDLDYLDRTIPKPAFTTDGTVQAQIRLTSETVTAHAGLLFRVQEIKHSNGSDYIGYTFCIKYMKGKCVGYELRAAKQSHFEDSAILVKGALPKTINARRSLLLAVSMQQNALDLYINLQHLRRVYDSTFPGGMTGVIFADEHRSSCNLIVTYYRVWEK